MTRKKLYRTTHLIIIFGILFLCLKIYKNSQENSHIRMFANSIKKDTHTFEHLKPPPKLTLFLDSLFKKYSISSQDIINDRILQWKLHKAGCRTIKFADGKLVTQVPTPFQTFLIKAHTSRKYNNDLRNINRAYVANEIKNLVSQHNLQHIQAPQSYLYHIPSADHTLKNSNYLVITEKHKLNTNTKIITASKDIIKECLFIIAMTGFFDAAINIGDNISFNDKNKIVFIDNENALQVDIHAIFFDDLSYIPPLKETVEKASYAKCYTPLPQETFLAYALATIGKETQNPKLTKQALTILKKIITCYGGIFPFLHHRGNIAVPYIRMLIADVNTIFEKIETKHTYDRHKLKKYYT